MHLTPGFLARAAGWIVRRGNEANPQVLRLIEDLLLPQQESATATSLLAESIRRN
jgi:hypothetical protein